MSASVNRCGRLTSTPTSACQRMKGTAPPDCRHPDSSLLNLTPSHTSNQSLRTEKLASRACRYCAGADRQSSGFRLGRLYPTVWTAPLSSTCFQMLVVAGWPLERRAATAWARPPTIAPQGSSQADSQLESFGHPLPQADVSLLSACPDASRDDDGDPAGIAAGIAHRHNLPTPRPRRFCLCLSPTTGGCPPAPIGGRRASLPMSA